MSEDHLIRYCAPTLAGIKTGSLFGCSCGCIDDLRKSVRALNKRLTPKGLRLLPLRFSDGRALMYIYRPSCLQRDLRHDAASLILRKYGYCTDSCEHCIAQLSRRLTSADAFPHEIGLFLGYPPKDVAGFIEHSACGSKYTGYWKVYGDVDSARQKFEQFRKCSQVYQQCWENGSPLERLAICR